MNQLSPSALLVGALLAGFVLWLAKSNRLGAYYGLLFASAPASSSNAPSLNPLSPNFNPLGAGQQSGTAFRNWLKGLFGG